MCCRLAFREDGGMERFRACFADLVDPRTGNAQLLEILALYEDVRLGLDDPATPVDDACQTVDGDHGRIETRRAMVAHDVAWLAERHDFPGLAAVAKISATRAIDGKATTASRYYLLRPSSAAPASPRSGAPTGRSKTARTGCSTW
jgi:hypothetical protein